MPSLPEAEVARPISLSTPDTGVLFRSGFTVAAMGLRVMAVEQVYVSADHRAAPASRRHFSPPPNRP